jgi:hypothetical protein
MINTIFETIQEHLSMLDLAVSSSEKIKKFAKNENLEAVINETENRERIVNIVGQIQRNIEDQINLLNPEEIPVDGISILKSWFHDLTILSEKMLSIDKETVDFLSQQKEGAAKEISLIFKNKEIIKSYNHEGSK